MKLKLLTIPLNPQTGTIEDEVFEVFQKDKEIRKFHPRFFNVGETMYLGVLIAYDEKHPLKQKHRPSFKKKSSADHLDEKEKQLFEEMKKLRKEKASVLGLPPYVLGTVWSDSSHSKKMQNRSSLEKYLRLRR